MGPKLPGYWLMTWLGLTGNLLALPVIGLVAFQASSLQAATISVAFALAWPAAIVGIVASAGLLCERHWGVILAIVSLSMALAGSLPYGIVRLSLLALGGGDQAIVLGVATIVLGLLNVLALLYWCRPGHRRVVASERWPRNRTCRSDHPSQGFWFIAGIPILWWSRSLPACSVSLVLVPPRAIP